MENLSHSRQPNRASTALCKKLSNGKGNSGSFEAKTAYDDVFGGPPKFGVATLSPRVEDYREIFGGFQVARASSIPILDLPAIDEAEVSFDVQSSSFDYSEVFGGFDGLDFAVSHEELVFEQSNGGDDFSSEEAWTPAGSGSLSEESDHSGKDPSLSNADSYHLFDSSTEFSISYHKANQRRNEDMSNDITHITQLHAVPTFTYVVDGTSTLKKTEDENSSLQMTGYSNLCMNFSGELMKEKYLKKTMSHPPNGSTGRQTFENDPKPQRSHGKNGSCPNEMLVSVAEINLRTQPSQLPPPSRRPPLKGDSSKLSSNCKDVASEGTAGDSSPPFFDVEIDASSSAAASAAAMKKAMEKAQAKLKTAKELMEQKKDGFQSCAKLGSKNNIKDKKEKVSKVVIGTNSLKDERLQGTCEKEDNGMKFSMREEKQKVMGITQAVPDSQGGTLSNMAQKSAEEKHRKESWSHEGSDKIDGADEWTEATQFFELVRTDKSRKAFEQENNEKFLVQNAKTLEHRQKEKKEAVEAFEQQEDYGKKINVVREDQQLEAYEKKLKVAKGNCVREENSGRSKATKELCGHKEREKKAKVANNVREQAENEKRFRMAQQPVEIEKKLTETDESEKHESFVKLQRKENKYEVEQVTKHRENEQKLKEANKRMENEKRCEREDNEKRQKEVFEREENGKRLKEALEQEEKEKSRMVFEWDKKEKQQNEARERKENEKILKEALLRVENEKRQKETLEREENEKKLKETLEQEENKKKQKEACEREKTEKKLKEALEQEEKDKQLKEAHEKVEAEKKLKDACGKEYLERSLKEARELEDNSNTLKQVQKRDESESRLKEPFELEEIENASKEASKLEETEKRLKDAGGREEPKGLNKANDKTERDKILEFSKGTSVHLHVVEDIKGSDEACNLDDNKIPQAVQSACEHEGDSGKWEATHEACAHGHGKLRTKPKESGKDSEAIEMAKVLVDERFSVSGRVLCDLEHEENRFRMEDTTESILLDDSIKKAGEDGIGIGQTHFDQSEIISENGSDPENKEREYAHEWGHRGKNIKQAQVALNQEENKNKFSSTQVTKEWIEKGKKIEVAQSAVLEEKENIQKTGQLVDASQSSDRKEKNLKEALPSEDREIERMKRERQLEEDRLRKIEEDREREREREKDRMAVDRATLEARERAYSESRERAERAAMERAIAEARQRAMTEARERLERACAEAREKSLAEKAIMEAKLRTERAAVERATAEVRERAVEKAMVEKAAFEARERVERSTSDKFSASSRFSGMRQNSSSSDQQDLQFQSADSSSGSRYPYSSVYGERSEGVEGESAQRCKARLERHQRTAERAAKALAEKNMRDLLAQREQTERNRLAETLDADVKRWSSGKEGNLRALLSTLQYILGPDSGWQPVPLTDVITAAAVKKAYRKATLCVHPDKLQQRGASIQHKYICEKVFDLLKEAWNRFNSEER